MRRALARLLLAAVVVAGCDTAGAAAATVNGADIPMAELRVDTRLASADPRTQQLLEIDDSGRVREDLRARVLTQRIEDAVIAQGGRTLGVDVTEADVDEAHERLVTRAGGERQLATRLEGVDVDDAAIRRLARSLATARAVEDALARRIEIDRAELAAHHERTVGTATVRHIVVDTRAEAARLRSRVAGGADFAALARSHSLDDDTRDDGGMLGTLDRDAAGRQGGSFADAVFGAGAGLLAPVRTFQGWHVVEVLERDPGPPLDVVADELRRELQSEQVGDVYSSWVRDRIDAAEVRVDEAIGTWDTDDRRVQPPRPVIARPAIA